MSLFVFKTLNKLESSLADEVWNKISYLGLDQQKLWHSYKDLSGENEGVFIEKIRSLSQDLMAVRDTDIWYLRRAHGFTLKQELPLNFFEWKANKMIESLRFSLLTS